MRAFRAQFTTGTDVVDPETWAGSIPQATGIAPRVRIGRSRWFNVLWLLPIGLVLLLVAASAAKGLRGGPAGGRRATDSSGVTTGTVGRCPQRSELKHRCGTSRGLLWAFGAGSCGAKGQDQRSLPDEMSVFETEIVARVAHAGQLRRPAANVEVLGRTFP